MQTTLFIGLAEPRADELAMQVDDDRVSRFQQVSTRSESESCVSCMIARAKYSTSALMKDHTARVQVGSFARGVRSSLGQKRSYGWRSTN